MRDSAHAAQLEIAQGALQESPQGFNGIVTVALRAQLDYVGGSVGGHRVARRLTAVLWLASYTGADLCSLMVVGAVGVEPTRPMVSKNRPASLPPRNATKAVSK